MRKGPGSVYDTDTVVHNIFIFYKYLYFKFPNILHVTIWF